MPQGALLALALVALVMLPCLVAAVVINADRCRLPSLRRRRSGARRLSARRSSWQERWTLIRLERTLAREPADLRIVLDAIGQPGRQPIEQIASDLRRLGRHRLGLANRNPIWYDAVSRAYDDQLRLACGCLDIQQHLTELDGLDLEIERVRVEGELAAAGLFLGPSDTERPQDHGRDRR